MHTGEPDPSPDPQRPETQLDFFHKLGYSTAQVEAVKQQFGPGMDTDKVLGELVRVRAPREAGPGPVTTMSVLLARGDINTAGLNLQLPATAATTTSSEESSEDEDALRPVVIDGSNVAMSHGNKEVFSCLGIQLTVNFFLDRGHTDVTVFVPSWRKEQPRPDVPITDQHILRDLERRKILVFTPSRRVAGKRVVCNDDWFIVKLAYESDGIIVSNDMYRDLKGREPEWKRFIEERLLMYSFVNNKFMPPDDPLGRHGPTLENFLRRYPRTQKKQPCPYGKKCTYGTKCKFHHPARTKQSNHSVVDEHRENTKLPSTPQKQSPTHLGPVPGQSLLLVEDMAKKLTLRHDSVSSKITKDQKKEHVTQAKPSHRSGKRTTSRKIGHHSSDHGSVQHGGSEEQLDSGLGSIDSQVMEAPWSDHQYGGSYGSLQHSHSVRQKFCPPRGAPCSCCSSQPHFHNQQYEPGPVSSHGSDFSYNPPHFTSYGPYPHSMHAYSHPADSRSHHHSHQQQQQRYWSAPFAGSPSPPAAVRNLPGDRTLWKPPQVTQRDPDGREEREAVRTKLLAIFSAELVDTAMEMSPQEMDPQVLVAEILMLQSQGRPLR